MGNFIVSYDLNGPSPTHAEMDEHLKTLNVDRGRILETVWYVGYSGTLDQLYDYVDRILSVNDRLFVTECREAVLRNLLVTSSSLISAWNRNR